MRRIEVIITVLVLAVVAGVVIASPRPVGEREAIPPVAWPASGGDGVLELSWMGIPDYADALPGSWIQRNLEDRFRVRFDPIFLSWTGSEKRKPLMFAAGEVPDVIWEGDPLGVRRNVEHGFVLPIPYGLIVEHAPTHARLLNDVAPEAWLFSRVDGENFGVPTLNADNTRPTPGIWRMDWLERVGIGRVPETVDEMEEAFRRFREDDPDGNGRKDTWGTAPLVYHWSHVFADVFSAHGILPFDFIERDGRLVWGGVVPETEAVLDRLRDWNRRGFFLPDFPLLSGRGQGFRAFSNGLIGYIQDASRTEHLDLDNPGSLTRMTLRTDPDARVVASAPLRVGGGEPHARAWGGAAHVLQFGGHLRDEPEKVVRVLEMLETLATDPALYVRSRVGEEGVHWELDPAAGVTLLPPYDDRKETAREMLRANGLVGGTGFFSPSTIGSAPLDPWIPASQRDFDNRHRPREAALVNPIGKSDALPSAPASLSDLRQLQTKFFLEYVTDNSSIGFEEFVETWNRRGGAELTEEANAQRAELDAVEREIRSLVAPAQAAAATPTGGRG